MQDAETDFQKLVGKLLTDRAYQQRLGTDPEAALREIGLKATKQRLDALKGVTGSAISKVAEAFGDIYTPQGG
jgi:hypothetical protein